MLNKNDLVACIAEKSGLTKADAGRALDAFTQTVTETLSKGDEVRLVNFGSFVVFKRAATEGRNPRTGEKIAIPASNTPKFRAGKALKEAVN